jgi:N-hydroxyarylamine O-acetyltransferase
VIDAYFARIGYAVDRAPTLGDLALLQPRAIAFENLEVVAGGVPRLELDAIVGKLVHGGRGGYCYEQNSLLHAVLTALGFRVTALLARVRFGLPDEVVTGRSHMVLRVDLPEGPHIIDAGFGNMTVTAPLKLVLNEVQKTPHEDFRLVAADSDFMLQVRLGDNWADVYRFDLAPQLAPDIAAQNWHTATRPNAMFANNVIATRTVPGGRHVLFNATLTWRPVGQAPERRPVVGEAALDRVFREVFSLAVPPAELAAAARIAAAAEAHNPSFA